MAKAAGFDNWVSLLQVQEQLAAQPGAPGRDAVEDGHADQHADLDAGAEPVQIWVDTEGNQLPYIDKIQLTLAENLEVLNLRAIAGEYDMQERHIDIGKLPVLLENQQKGNYKVAPRHRRLRRRLRTQVQPELRGRPRDRASGSATPTSAGRSRWASTATRSTRRSGSGPARPARRRRPSRNKYNPGPEYRTKWATLDIKQANEMLDKIGLDKKDAEGYRLRTDGKGRLRIEVDDLGRPVHPVHPISEMIREQWKKIGIDLNVRRSSGRSARSATPPTRTRSTPGRTTAASTCTRSPATSSRTTRPAAAAPLYADWFQSNGQEGKEPPAKLKEVMEKLQEGVRRARGGADQARQGDLGHRC